MNLLGSERRMLKQTFMQMGKVSVRISRRRHALVHLHHIHVLPRNILVGQGTKHLPRRVAATNREIEAATRVHCRASLGSHDLSALSSHRIGIGEYFNLHGNSWPNATFVKSTIEN